jgi:flagellar biogenesis protein FliO
MGEVLSLLFPLVVVIVIIVAAHYTTKWIAGKQNAFTSGNVIRVIERVAVARDTYMLIVSVDERPYLVSASNDGVRILEELPPDILEKYKSAGKKHDFTSYFASLLGEKLTGRNDAERRK